jgi:TrwC relaxase
LAVVATLTKGYDLDYIWRQVDCSLTKDAAGYYIQASEGGGEPPGRWWGPGAKALGLEPGRVVEREPYDLLFGERKAPDGTPLGRAAGGRFFADLPDLSRQAGHPAEHLATVMSAAARTLERHPAFLRLLIGFAVQPPATGDQAIRAVVRRVRDHALELLRAQIAAAFGDDPRGAVTDQLARFALAAIDGAFVACQADRGSTLEGLLRPLVPSLVASRRVLLGAAE